MPRWVNRVKKDLKAGALVLAQAALFLLVVLLLSTRGCCTRNGGHVTVPSGDKRTCHNGLVSVSNSEL
jgi:hypothetical protein